MKNKMKLWLITTEEYSWDDYKGFVVRAETEDQARTMAEGEAGTYSNGSVFADKTKSKCEEIKAKGEAGVILDSFNAG